MPQALVRAGFAATAALVLLTACSSGTDSGGGTGVVSVPQSLLPPTAPQSTTAASTTGATGTASASGANLCRLITKVEARAALGVPVGNGVNSAKVEASSGVVGSCLYRATDVKTHPISVVSLAILGTTIPVAAFEKQIRTRAPEAKSLAGLGEEAFTIPGVVFAYDKGLVLSLQVSTGADPVDTAKVVPLARTALGRSEILR